MRVTSIPQTAEESDQPLELTTTMAAKVRNDAVILRASAEDAKDLRLSISRSQCTSPIIPWNLDRRVLLTMFLIIGFLTGSFLFNWPPAQSLYLRSGAYSWLCRDNSTGMKNATDYSAKLNSLSDSELFDVACDEQVQAVDSLMPIGVASIFVFAFIGGLSVDYLGPKISALMGLTFQISGWIVLAFCDEQFPAYPIANMLMGFGNDPMYIALLDSSNLFPQHRGMVIAILSASRSLSFVLPSVFNLILNSYPEGVTFTTIALSYVGVLLFCFVATLLIFPWRCFATETNESDLQSDTTERLGFPFNSWGTNGQKPYDVTSNASLPTRCGPTDFSFFSNATTVGSTYSISSNFRPSRAIPPRTAPPPDFAMTSFISNSATPKSTTSIPVYPSISTTPISTSVTPTAITSFTPSTPSTKFHSLWSIINSGLFLPLLPIAATTILSGTFFANSSRDQLGSALTMFIVLNPLSFLSGVFMGYLNDVYGPLLVMCIMNVLSLLQFTSLLFEDVSFIVPYISAFVSFLVLSFFLTQFYCYVALTFPGRHFGTLSGFIVMCSGLFSLVVTPMCDFSSFAANFVPMNGLCLGLTATNLIFLYVLYRSQGCRLVVPAEGRHTNNRSSESNSNDCVAVQELVAPPNIRSRTGVDDALQSC